MKKFILLILPVISAVIFSGCSTSTPTVLRNTNAGTNQTKYAIAPFLDANSVKDRKAYPDAATVVRTAVVSAFLRQGKYIVQNNADIQINGVVTAYYQGAFGGRYTTVGIELNATDIKTDQLLWNASLTRRTGFIFDYDPSMLSQKTADELVDKIFASNAKK